MRLPEIQRASDEPIRRQIYEQLRSQILCGEMPAGEALPSTRQLAGELSLSRSTVVEAYDMLLAEGFLASRQGAQTVVAEGLVMETSPKLPTQERTREHKRLLADFSTGRPDLSLFPRAQWVKLLSTAAAELPARQYGYTGPQGDLPLREEIAVWLSRSRGLVANAEDIFITAGATQALRVLTDLLCANGGRVMVEDPCHKGLYDTLSVCNCQIIPASADDHGLQTDRLSGDERAQMIYITPSHQFPMGGILPASRRAALIRYAREYDSYIVEDDYDSEFRYTGAPIAPLYALDTQRVVYVGTFSKTLFPALRIGFVILPKNLQPRWRELRTHHDVQNPPFEQAALAELLRSRKFDRHVRTMKRVYEKRRQVLLDALKATFGEGWSACGDAAGLHVTIRFPGQLFDAAFSSRCAEAGVHVVPLETHCIVKGAHKDALVLGFGHLEPEQIITGVGLLAQVMGDG
jgi:GntR family transcriptional regulator / MocR family aminotransferase